MKADYIKDIMESYDGLPYKCIIFDGPWGVGKTHAIKKALSTNDNVCNISMFGIKDAQEIYHEAFFQLVMKDKKNVKTGISKVIDAAAVIFDKIAVAKGVIESLIKEKELFLNISKEFENIHYIVIDDLERMNKDIRLEEVFGVIEELKSCDYVKVVLIANTNEILDKELFNKYSEKVIDKTYYVSEPPGEIDWKELNIDEAFITKFLSNHDVKNLRTLQKAQNFYKDVELKLNKEYAKEFYDEIKLACYAIVVEKIDNLYYREIEENQNDAIVNIVNMHCNMLETRIKDKYLFGTRISNNMVDILQKYYENNAEIITEEIDAEYQMFIKAGEKANYYKSDEEMKNILIELADEIRQAKNIANLLSNADQYFIWSEVVQLTDTQLIEEYKIKLYNLIYEETMKNDIAGLTYEIESIYLQSEINRNILREIQERVKKEVINEYIKYLSENTYDKKASQYSYKLREFMNSTAFRDIIVSCNLDKLYNEKSFPIYDVTEQQYRTAYNIMYVLYHKDANRFLAYCDEVKKNCDNMARHRIDVLVKELTEKQY